MIEIKLAFRNLIRDRNMYIILVVATSVFLALIIGFQSTILGGDLGKMLGADDLTDRRLFFKIGLWLIASVQYVLLFLFLNSYYRFINKVRVRELALYKIIGYGSSSVFRITLAEGAILFVAISTISVVLAKIFGILIISFINSYLMLDKTLTSSLNLNVILTSIFFFLIVILLNSYRAYRKTIKMDLDVALSESAVQRQIKPKSKIYIIITFTIGMLLLINMTYLTTLADFSLRFGIIIMAILYGYGLYLIINSIVSGYKYLTISSKKTGFNTLLNNETNFHLNKSKFVIFSSVIFMMMSIGALLLSQVITDELNKSIGEANYTTYLNTTANYIDTPEIYMDDTLLNVETYILTTSSELASKEYGVKLEDKPALYVYEDFSNSSVITNDTVTVELDEKLTIPIIMYTDEELESLNENDSFSTNPCLVLPDDILMSDSNFKSYQSYKLKYDALEKYVSEGKVNSSTVSTAYYIPNTDYEGAAIMLIKQSDYNQAMELIGGKTLDLKDDEIWIDGYYSDSMEQLNVVGTSQTGVEGTVVSDKYYEQLKDDAVYWDTSDIKYYMAESKEVQAEVDDALEAIDDRNFGVIVQSWSRNEVLGTSAFVLLMAFYIAIIFIFCNFTLVATNLLSHGIENKLVYSKMLEIGITAKAKRKYVSKLVNTFYGIPIVIGVISGLIVTNFAIHLVLFGVKISLNYKLIVVVMALYLLSLVIFILLTKLIYMKVIED